MPPAAARGSKGLVDKVGTAQSVGDDSPDARWITIAFTWDGLRALGLDEASLSSFPDEFKQGMAARAEILGITGANHPDNWLGDLANPALHAIAILFARDETERRAMQKRTRKLPGAAFLASSFSPHWISPPFLHTTIRTSTSAIVIASRTPLSRGLARSLRLVRRLH